MKNASGWECRRDPLRSGGKAKIFGDGDELTQMAKFQVPEHRGDDGQSLPLFLAKAWPVSDRGAARRAVTHSFRL